jgi:Tol biopolymer transport system component
MDADGSNPVNLTNTPTCDAYEDDADWSPTGEPIAFGSGMGGNPHIWLIDPDGSTAVNLTEDLPGSRSPSWSPDGQQIAFSKSCTIWVMNADGSDAHAVTGGGCDAQPAWSPDGSKIVFASSRDGDEELYVLDLATGGTTQLTFDDSVDTAPT